MPPRRVRGLPADRAAPYRGASIELQASLYEILGKNNLRTAVDILTSFASLVTPPVSTALTIVDLVASGVEKIIEANATDPVLVLQGTLAAPGGGLANELRPGWLAVVRATEDELPAANCTSPRDGFAGAAVGSLALTT